MLLFVLLVFPEGPVDHKQSLHHDCGRRRSRGLKIGLAKDSQDLFNFATINIMANLSVYLKTVMPKIYLYTCLTSCCNAVHYKLSQVLLHNKPADQTNNWVCCQVKLELRCVLCGAGEGGVVRVWGAESKDGVQNE